MTAQFHAMKKNRNIISISFMNACPYKRHYHSNLSIWLSVDPMADKYPRVSPYVYCGNNPVKIIDPKGEELWIVGEGANSDMACNATFQQLQSSTNLRLKRNSDGKISIIGGETKNATDETLQNLINDDSGIKVIITATISNIDGDVCTNGGSHMGTKYNGGKPCAEQWVNPYLTLALDVLCGERVGTTMLHEVTEAYQCCLYSKENKQNIEMAVPGSSTYNSYLICHNQAAPQPVWEDFWNLDALYAVANSFYKIARYNCFSPMGLPMNIALQRKDEPIKPCRE